MVVIGGILGIYYYRKKRGGFSLGWEKEQSFTSLNPFADPNADFSYSAPKQRVGTFSAGELISRDIIYNNNNIIIIKTTLIIYNINLKFIR